MPPDAEQAPDDAAAATLFRLVNVTNKGPRLGQRNSGPPALRTFGTISRSMYLMTRVARSLFLPGFDTTDQSRPFTRSGATAVDRQSNSCARRQAEFGGVTDHVRGCLVGGADQRVLNRVAVAGLDWRAGDRLLHFQFAIMIAGQCAPVSRPKSCAAVRDAASGPGTDGLYSAQDLTS